MSDSIIRREVRPTNLAPVINHLHTSGSLMAFKLTSQFIESIVIESILQQPIMPATRWLISGLISLPDSGQNIAVESRLKIRA
jgi:hypothetical protein